MIPLLGIVALLHGQTPAGTLTVHVDRPLHPMPKGFYGLMTEEINHSYDGGLYGELVRNRFFKDRADTPVGWSPLDGATLALRDVALPTTALTRALRVEGGGVANEGFWGFPVRPNTPYRATLWVRADADARVTVALESADGAKVYAKASAGVGNAWRKVELRLRTGAVAPTQATRLAVRANGPFLLAGASLFGRTYKDRPNGNRPDLMGLLAGLRPTFLRLPGGNYLEGDTLADRFDWKATLGPVEGRPGHQAPWGYRSSDGLGLLEYLEWCEDLKVKPLLAVFAGYALRGEHVEPGSALAPFVQDALDEIEYVTGSTATKWGAVRAKGGHPKPFPLEYVEIGNEDWFDRSGSYDGRFAQFYDAIRARYPKLRIIATATVKSRTPDVMDDHYYRTAAEMARDSAHYRNADRKGPKVFVGEWASLQGDPTPDFQAALGDAAWLTGLERDSDVVTMEAYAPLLTNVNPGARQWNTNLIGYDALTAFGSPAYWVQALYAGNTGDTVLPVDVATDAAPEAFPYRGRAGLGPTGGEAEFKEARVTGRVGPNGAEAFGNWTQRGDWNALDHFTLHGSGRNARAFVGDPAWDDYTLTVKARRIGEGGFAVLFHSLDDHNAWQWNVGGATNEIRHQEVFSNRVVAKGDPVPAPVGEWVDLRLEVEKGHVRGFVDGRLAIEADEAPPAVPTLYASATQRGGETFLKVVNLSASPTSLRLDLPGAKGALAVSGWLLRGSLWTQNTADAPDRLLPEALAPSTLSPGGTYAFPAHSVTVLRLKAR